MSRSLSNSVDLFFYLSSFQPPFAEIPAVFSDSGDLLGLGLHQEPVRVSFADIRTGFLINFLLVRFPSILFCLQRKMFSKVCFLKTKPSGSGQ